MTTEVSPAAIAMGVPYIEPRSRLVSLQTPRLTLCLCGALRDFDLQGALLGLGEQVLVQVGEAMAMQGVPPLEKDCQELLKRQIADLCKDNNPIRKLIGERVQSYLQAMLGASPTQRSPALPPALSLLAPEFTQLASALGRILHFNRSVFGPFYAPILRRVLFPEGETETGEDSR